MQVSMLHAGVVELMSLELLVLLVQSVVFGVLGALVGRARGRTVEGVIWGLALGPLGLGIFLYLTWNDEAPA